MVASKRFKIDYLKNRHLQNKQNIPCASERSKIDISSLPLEGPSREKGDVASGNAGFLIGGGGGWSLLQSATQTQRLINCCGIDRGSTVVVLWSIVKYCEVLWSIAELTEECAMGGRELTAAATKYWVADFLGGTWQAAISNSLSGVSLRLFII